MRAPADKAPIAPMVQTQWNQGAPYNNLCPEYAKGKRSVTGCVATAMAQCMYFTEKRVGSEGTLLPADIPSYTTNTYKIHVSGVENGININWKNMKNSYDSDDHSGSAEAVAQLMKYCGTSVQMDYGPSSGANPRNVVVALKNYFGYNETAQYVNRNAYSYANWIDMMYHELSHNRVIHYSGFSSTSGHSFVCDGYQNEDFFHINWGWGGKSDNYFKLSALNPYEQGIGGSSSNDGFHSSQGAVIGIQKAYESGTVLDVEPQGKHWLKLSSQKVDKPYVKKGETVTFTYRITNNGDGIGGGDDFDGDIWLYDNLTNKTLNAKAFFIAKGDTLDCAISFTTPNTVATYEIRPIYWYDNIFYNVGGSLLLTINVTESGDARSDLEYLETGILSDHLEPEADGSVRIYGRTAKLNANIRNKGSEAYRSGINVSLYDWSKKAYVDSLTVDADIPAGEERRIDFEFEGLDYNNAEGYSVSYFHKNSGKWSPTLHPIHGITTYFADGTERTVKPVRNIGLTNDVVALDISGVSVVPIIDGIPQISFDEKIPSIAYVYVNSNPNTLYIVGDNIPLGLNGKNIVQNGVASKISLTDGENFFSPIDFTAEEIEFTYNNTKQADGTGGWSTIVLPFDVQQVTADDSPISWFTSASDSGKDFWVKRFIDCYKGIVNFAYTSEMKAYTPYILALPGDHWGAQYDLSGKKIKFIANNATIKRTVYTADVIGLGFNFMGSTTQVTTQNIYTMNDAGTSFTLNASGGSPAFRAYLRPGLLDVTITALHIGSEPDGGTTGIVNQSSKTPAVSGDFFNLAGQRIAQPAKGLCIVNGKKILVK